MSTAPTLRIGASHYRNERLGLYTFIVEDSRHARVAANAGGWVYAASADGCLCCVALPFALALAFAFSSFSFALFACFFAFAFRLHFISYTLSVILPVAAVSHWSVFDIHLSSYNSSVLLPCDLAFVGPIQGNVHLRSWFPATRVVRLWTAASFATHLHIERPMRN